MHLPVIIPFSSRRSVIIRDWNIKLILLTGMAFGIFAGPLLGQESQRLIDSLEKVLPQQKTLDNRYQVLTDLCNAYVLIDPNQGIAYGNEAIDLAVGKEVYLDHTMSLYRSMGLCYYYLGQAEESLNYYLEAMRLGEEQGDQAVVGSILGNIGLLYYNQQDWETARQYIGKSIKVLEPLGASQMLINGINNMGNTFYMLQNNDSAFYYYNLGLSYAKELGDKVSLNVSYNSVAFMALAQGDYETARENYEIALGLSRELGDNNMILYILMNLADIHYNQSGYEKALKTYDEVLEIAISSNNTEVIQRAYYQISGIYRYQGDFENAYWFYAKYDQFKDSITSSQKDALMAEMKEKYETEKKEQQILSLEKDNKLKDLAAKNAEYAALKKDAELTLAQKENKLRTAMLEKEKMEGEQRKKQLEMERKDRELAESRLQQKEVEAQKEATFRNAVIGGAVLFLLLAIVAFISFINKRKDNRVIASQKDEVEAQKRTVEQQKHIVEEQHREILDSITYAQRIQEAILPPSRLVKEWLPNSFILYKPKDIVAGDFYWMESVDDLVIFAAADCTGHGVPGAMVSVVCHNAMNRAVREFGLRQPGEILDKTRKLVIDTFEKSDEEVKDGMDIALCALNTKNRNLAWAGANNPLWVIRNNTQEVEETKADKQPIGKFAMESPFTTHNVQLNPNDTLYVFSDGYPDQFGGEKGKKYKSGQMKKFLLSIQKESMTRQRELLDAEFESWRGDLEQIDDVCIIGVRV